MADLPRLSNVEYEILLHLRSGEKYGLELVKDSDGKLRRGTIYVTLDRMTSKGFVTSRAVANPAEPGMARRFYAITALGRRVVAARSAAEASFFAKGAPA